MNWTVVAHDASGHLSDPVDECDDRLNYFTIATAVAISPSLHEQCGPKRFEVRVLLTHESFMGLREIVVGHVRYLLSQLAHELVP